MPGPRPTALPLLLLLAWERVHGVGSAATDMNEPRTGCTPAASMGAAACLCHRSCHRDSGSRDVVLLQLRRESASRDSAKSVPIRSGDIVFLRSERSGRRITVQPDAVVHARWSHRGNWEQIAVERMAGPGLLRSGDVVMLRGRWGKPLTAQGRHVHAKWDHAGSWQKWVIETKAGGGIVSGSQIFLKAHTGSRMDADAPDSVGVVQARWSHMGSWQALRIEAKLTLVDGLAWRHFGLLKALRAAGYRCPGGQLFAPNPTPLIFGCRLWKAAQRHSEDMARQGYLSHVSRADWSPWDRAAEQGAAASAENIAGGDGSPEGTLQLLKNSDAHCRAMMNPSHKVAGVGYAAGGELQHYWTQLFGKWQGEVETWCYPD